MRTFAFFKASLERMDRYLKSSIWNGVGALVALITLVSSGVAWVSGVFNTSPEEHIVAPRIAEKTVVDSSRGLRISYESRCEFYSLPDLGESPGIDRVRDSITKGNMVRHGTDFFITVSNDTENTVIIPPYAGIEIVKRTPLANSVLLHPYGLGGAEDAFTTYPLISKESDPLSFHKFRNFKGDYIKILPNDSEVFWIFLNAADSAIYDIKVGIPTQVADQKSILWIPEEFRICGLSEGGPIFGYEGDFRNSKKPKLDYLQVYKGIEDKPAFQKEKIDATTGLSSKRSPALRGFFD